MNIKHLLVKGLGGCLLVIAVMAGSSAKGWARSPILDEIVREGQVSAAQGVKPVVIMDLDETVVDTIPRRWAAYREIAGKYCGSFSLRSGPDAGAGLATCAALHGLNVSEIYGLPNRYDGAALARRLGLDPRSWDWPMIVEAMFEAYSSGRHEACDQPMAAANTYVQELKSVGVQVWYVSSRWEDVQAASTRSSLEQLGLLGHGESSQVVLRPRGMSSIDFKKMAFGRIREAVRKDGGKVIGAFENEPENINAMAQEFPGAALVFVEGAWVKEGSVPAQAARIVDYR